MSHKSFYTSCCMLLLTACGTVGEDYQKPAVNMPLSWAAMQRHPDALPGRISSRTNALPLNDWWKQFKDPLLNKLVERAVANNKELKVATARVLEARSQRRNASANLMPQVNGTAGTTASGGKASKGGRNDEQLAFDAGFDASWEIDLFGGNRRKVEAGLANEEAATAEQQQALSTLLAEVARSYCDLRMQQHIIELTKKNLAAQQETLRLTRIQFDAKAVGEFDVLRASAQVDETKSRLPQITTSTDAALNRLAVLVGEAPGTLDTMLKNIGPIPQANLDLLSQTPAFILSQRPDIRAAERRLAQSTALHGVAVGEAYPKLTLSALFGLGGSTLYTGSTPWSLGMNLIAPLFSFGRIQSQIDAADARQQQAYHSYLQAVLLGLEETDNALTATINEKRRVILLESAAASNKKAAVLARIKFRVGEATFLDVMVQEQNVLESETRLAEAQANASRNLIALYKALGGGVMTAEDAASPENTRLAAQDDLPFIY